MLRPGLQQVLDSQTAPAVIHDGALDQRGANESGRALHTLPGDPPRITTTALFLFLDVRAQTIYRAVDLARRNSVALLRAAAGRDPHDEALTRVVGQLTTQSQDFSRLSSSRDVLRYRHGVKRYRHPVVGDLDFGY